MNGVCRKAPATLNQLTTGNCPLIYTSVVWKIENGSHFMWIHYHLHVNLLLVSCRFVKIFIRICKGSSNIIKFEIAYRWILVELAREGLLPTRIPPDKLSLCLEFSQDICHMSYYLLSENRNKLDCYSA